MANASGFVLTQLHGGARLVDRMLTGAQAVLQLRGCGLRRRSGNDAVDQRRGGTGRRGPRGPWRRGIRDFTAELTTTTTSSISWTGQTRAPCRAHSKSSPLKQKEESYLLLDGEEF